MAANKHKGPLRGIVEEVMHHDGNFSRPLNNTKILYKLECGHSVSVPRSNYKSQPKRCRCDSCGCEERKDKHDSH